MRDAAVVRAWRALVKSGMAGADRHFGFELVHGVVERLVVAGLEQQVTRERRGPFRLRDVLGRLALHQTGGGRDGPRQVGVATHLVRPVEHRRHFVLRGQLCGNPGGKGLDAVVVDGLGAVRIDRAADVVVVGPVAARDKKPHAILHDRTVQGVVDVVLAVQLRREREAARHEIRIRVLTREAAVRKIRHQFAGELVAAGPRNAVDEDARELVFGGAAAHLNGNFLGLRFVVVHARTLAAGEHGVGNHPVDQRSGIAGHRAMDREAAADPHRGRAADVELAGRHGGHRAGHRHEVAAGRQRFEHLARDHLAALARLHVDDGALGRDRNALLDGADCHLDIDGRDEVRLEHDAFANDRREARQRKGHGVSAGPEIDDAVLTRVIGDRRARLLDQRGAAGLYGHSGQHTARCILDDPGDGALAALLRQQRVGQHGYEHDEHDANELFRHSSSSLLQVDCL